MKKIVKGLIFASSLAAVAMFFPSCGQSYNTIKKMQRLEEGVENPTKIDELRDAIAKYDKRAIDLATTQAQEGVWWKILGTRYLDEQEYGKAYECFQQELQLPEDERRGLPSDSILQYASPYGRTMKVVFMMKRLVNLFTEWCEIFRPSLTSSEVGIF